MNSFEQRRKDDPQGVIDSLVKQTSLQAKEINRLTNALLDKAEAVYLLNILLSEEGKDKAFDKLIKKIREKLKVLL